MMVAMPTPLTNSVTAPGPRNRLTSAVLAAIRATRMSDGGLTSTAWGGAGEAVNGSTAATAATWSGSARRYTRVGRSSRFSRDTATGKLTRAASAISGADVTGGDT